MQNKQRAIADLQTELNQVPLKIQGKVPHWLLGTFVRNGPVTVTIDGKTNFHWFDGLAMLHAFHFQQGKVNYTNQFLRTDAYKAVFDENTLAYLGFAVDPCRSLFKRFLSLFIPPTHYALQNANVNVAKIADAYVALTEIPLPVQFDLDTLKTLGVLDYQDALPKDRSWESAHPHRNPLEKETLNYIVEFGRKSFYTLYKIADGSTTRQVISRVPVEHPAYMHSFSITENYIVLTAYPYTVNPLNLMLGTQPFIQNYSWHPNQPTEMIVVERTTGKLVGHFPTRPFFSFHHANAFEEDGKIHVDAVTYADASILTGLSFIVQADPVHKTTPIPQLERFTLDLATGKIFSEILLNQNCEFPRIHSSYDGRPYRFVYLTSYGEKAADAGVGLIKFDTHSRKTWQWKQLGSSTGEPVFIPAPTATSEDDGVVLTIVHDLKQMSSFLLILDAKTFQELGRAEAPHVIPDGLHGQFF